MNDNTLELLSAYLDGRGTESERKLVEEMLCQDEHARQALEDMRQLCGSLDRAVPPNIQVPPEFRPAILRRIRASALGGGLVSWILAGTVLTALIGSMAYMDYQRDARVPKSLPKQNSEALVMKALAAGSNGSAKSSPGLPPLTMVSQKVAPENIQSAEESDSIGPGNQGGMLLTGDVYTWGRGNSGQKPARIKGGLYVKQAEAIDISQASSAVNRLDLEKSSGWTRARIAEMCQQIHEDILVQPEIILALAQRNNLNPGLIIAASLYNETEALNAKALRIRRALNQSLGQNEDKRLAGIITALGGDETWMEKWEQILRCE